jgi:hypothetical protein
MLATLRLASSMFISLTREHHEDTQMYTSHHQSVTIMDKPQLAGMHS